MLVLSRKENEWIDITVGNETVAICLTRIRGVQARLGFDAAPHVRINRREVATALNRQIAIKADQDRLSA